MDARRLFWVLMGVSFLALLLGLALKAPCLTHEWTDEYQYRTYCYTDILPLYYGRGLDADRIPYVEEFNEYPVLTGLLMYVTALAATSENGFFLANALVLLAAGVLASWAIVRLGLPWQRTLLWSASPALMVHAFTNWDLLAVALAAWGWVRWREGKAFESGLWFGLGGAAKLYPAFFLPFLALALLRDRDVPRLRSVAGGGLLGLGVPNAVVLALAPSGWLATWRFHAGRGSDWESVWGPAEAVLGWERVPTLAIAALLLVAAASLGFLVWKKRAEPLAAAGIFVLAFLLVNRVYSPQYTLWALPILAALPVRWGLVAAFSAADLAVFAVRYQFFIPEPGSTDLVNDAWAPWHRTAVLLRWLALLAILLVLAADWRRRPEAAQPVSPTDEPLSNKPLYA